MRRFRCPPNRTVSTQLGTRRAPRCESTPVGLRAAAFFVGDLSDPDTAPEARAANSNAGRNRSRSDEKPGSGMTQAIEISNWRVNPSRTRCPQSGLCRLCPGGRRRLLALERRLIRLYHPFQRLDCPPPARSGSLPSRRGREMEGRWDREQIAMSRVVDVIVSQLRRLPSIESEAIHV